MEYFDKKIEKNHLINRLSHNGPKRILALDGGGIRGALTIGFLEKIESELASRHCKTHPDFRLSDYYDMIGGTSTGAIIAVCLANGMKVCEVKELYLSLGENIFSSWKKKLPIWLTWFKNIVEILEILFASAHFKEKNLEDDLKKQFGEMTFGSEDFKTGLCIVTKRADTLSTWVMHTHPEGKYYNANKDLLIRALLRATSAAPSYFRPKKIRVANDEDAVFIDGAVSSFNNPALIMFYITTLSNLPYKWKTGQNNLLITSLGTGFNHPKKDAKDLENRKIYKWAADIPDLFMSDATSLNQLVLQTLGYTQTPQYINSEFNDLKNVSILSYPMMTYQRYNVSLDKNNLQQAMERTYTHKEIAHLAEISNGENAPELYKIGVKFADRLIKAIHFPTAFDTLFGQLKTLLTQEDNLVISKWIKEKGLLYAKFLPVWARQAKHREDIATVTSSGEETHNIALPGDYIIMNQTEAKELYVVKSSNFTELYEYCEEKDKTWSEYIPVGRIYALKLSHKVLGEKSWPDHFFLSAQWGENQYCAMDDFLVCPIDGSEFYRIDNREFKETYKIVKA